MSTCQKSCCPCDQSKGMAKGSLDDLIKKLQKPFSDDKVDVQEVQSIMEAYQSREEDWGKYVKYSDKSYTRHLVDEGNGKYNLLILCWNCQQGSPIHSHADSHCFLKVLSGSVRETLYDWPSGASQEMLPKDAPQDFKKDQVTYINDTKGLHKVENVSQSVGAVTLHLYSPPYDMCSSFEQSTGTAQKVPVKMWTKYGEITEFGRSMDLKMPEQ